MYKAYLKRASLGLLVVVIALALSLLTSTPRLEEVNNLSIALGRGSALGLDLGQSFNEVRLVVNDSNSTETLIISSFDNRSRILLSTKIGSEAWLPAGGRYYLRCTSCTSPVEVKLRVELYRERGSLPLLVLMLIAGLAGGVYAMINLLNHFAHLALRRRAGG